MTKEQHIKEYSHEYRWLKKQLKWEDDILSASSMPTNFAETVELMRQFAYDEEHGYDMED